MLWPDALNAMAEKIQTQVVDVPVFLGAYAATPNTDAIYIWRSRALPAPAGLCGGAKMQVMVEVWIRALREARATTERETVNAQVYQAWLRHNQIIEFIRGMTFEDVNFYAQCQATHPDGGEFYPMVGEAVEFHVTYDNQPQT